MKPRSFNYLLDYPVVTQWWKAQEWPVIPRRVLPPVGIMVDDDKGKKLAAGWLYQTDTPISWIEWVVGNPEVDADTRGEAIDTLIDALKQKANQALKPVIYTSTSHPKFRDRLTKHGFVITDINMTNLILNGAA